jgi:hypothetical protein
MKKTLIVCSFLTFLLGTTFLPSAQAQTDVFAYASSNSGKIYQVNVNTGASLTLGTLSGTSANGTGLNRATDTVYYHSLISGVRHLVSWNQNVNTDYGDFTTFSLVGGGTAPAPGSNGEFFAGSYWYMTDLTDDLYRVNFSGGAVSNVQKVADVRGNAVTLSTTDIVFQDLGGGSATIFVTANGTPGVFKSDIVIASGAMSNYTALGTVKYAGLSMNSINEMFGALPTGGTTVTSTISKINTATGVAGTAVTVTGDAVNDRLTDLSYTGTTSIALGNVPEPGTLAFLGVGFVGFFAQKRKQNNNE